MNIYEKLQAITIEIGNINKNLTVGEGKASYRAVGEADVLKAVKEMEAKHKVYSYPCNRKIIDSSMLQTKKEWKGQVKEGNQIFLRLETVYRFVDIEKPEDHIDITTYGDGMDTQDKAPGKAMTYADKYALLKAYKIITEEDPDQNSSPDNIKIEDKKDKVTEVEAKSIQALMIRKGVDIKSNLEKIFSISSTDELTKIQYAQLIKKLNDMPDKKEMKKE